MERSKVIKTRVKHHCFGCGREIAVNSLMVRVTVRKGRVFDTTYWCRTCALFWDTFCSYEDSNSINFAGLRLSNEKLWEEVREITEPVEPDVTEAPLEPPDPNDWSLERYRIYK